MKLPRFRVSIRGMMLAVAVVATLLAAFEGVVVKGRQRAYRMRAQACLARELGARDQERIFREKAKEDGNDIETYGREYQRLLRVDRRPGLESVLRQTRRVALRRAELSTAMREFHLARARRMAALGQYYAALKQKYRTACDHPWQIVSPDPSPPPAPP